MKILIPTILIAVFLSCGVKKEPRPEYIDKRSIHRNANLTNLETAYVEDPVTGQITMTVTKRKETKSITKTPYTKTKADFPKAKSGDTLFCRRP